MATEKNWVWKHLLYPCLGSFLSNLDRMGSLLTCLLVPCQCSCFIPREKQTATSCRDKAALLVLSWLLAFPSQAESAVSLPHAQSEQSCDAISKSTDKGELPQLGRLRADWHARHWCKNDTKHGFDCK